MNLHLDTSALIKLYIEEEGSTSVARRVGVAALIATSRVAYAEARASLARRKREGAFSAQAHRRLVEALDEDFSALVIVELSADVAHHAGALAERRALRGFDAIHLASALELRSLVPGFARFATFDGRLADAAKAEGLRAPEG